MTNENRWFMVRAWQAEAEARMSQSTEPSLAAGEILKQDRAHILDIARLISQYQEIAQNRYWDPATACAGAYNTACDLVDNEDIELTDHEAEMLITVFVATAVMTS